MIPYVRINQLMLGENVEMKKENEAQTLPTIVTERHPNLFARADTIGPKNNNVFCVNAK